MASRGDKLHKTLAAYDLPVESLKAHTTNLSHTDVPFPVHLLRTVAQSTGSTAATCTDVPSGRNVTKPYARRNISRCTVLFFFASPLPVFETNTDPQHPAACTTHVVFIRTSIRWVVLQDWRGKFCALNRVPPFFFGGGGGHF